MPTLCHLSDLALAAKLVAKYAMTDKQNPAYATCSQVLLQTADSNLLYLFAWNLEKVALTRIYYTGDPLPPTLIPAKLLAELLESLRRKESAQVALEKQPGERLQIRVGRNTSRLNAGIALSDFRNVSGDIPAEWPADTEVVVKVLNELPQPSTEKVLFWKRQDLAAGGCVYTPAVGQLFAIPDFGLLAGEKRGKTWRFTDLETGGRVGSETVEEVVEKIKDAGPEKIAELRAAIGPVPDFYRKGPAPKGADKAQKLAEKIAAREEGYTDSVEALLTYAEVLGEQATTALVEGLKIKCLQDAEAEAREEAERAISRANAEAERKAEEYAATVEKERREAFAAPRFEEICLSFAPPKFKPERQAQWLVKNRVDFRVGLECWCKSQPVTDRAFYGKPTTVEFKRAHALWDALDRAYQPDKYAQSVEEVEELAAETPDDIPDSRTVAEPPPSIDPRAAQAIPALAPFCTEIQVRGWFTWLIAADKEAEQALRNAGYKFAYREAMYFGPPALAAKLPQRPCHSLPTITCLPY